MAGNIYYYFCEANSPGNKSCITLQIIIKTYISQKASTVYDQGLVPMTTHLNDKRKDTHQVASLGRSKTISENWTLPVFVLSFVRLVFLCLNGYTTWTKFCLFQWFLEKTGKPLTNHLVFSLPSFFLACFSVCFCYFVLFECVFSFQLCVNSFFFVNQNLFWKIRENPVLKLSLCWASSVSRLI